VPQPPYIPTDSAQANEQPPDGAHAALCLAARSLEARVVALETPEPKSPLKRITENAGAVALFLGLVLTFASLRDVFFTKPEADRVARASQFNQAVNSAAEIRQQVIEYQMQQGNDPALALAIASSATPRILNNIATARALRRGMDDEDVGIPQLIILISESFTAGDIPSTEEFVRRAVGRSTDSPFLRSEAKRFEAKFLYATGKPERGRQAFHEAVELIGPEPMAAGARAFTLADSIVLEFGFGDCAVARTALEKHGPDLRSAHMNVDARRQVQAGLISQLEQLRGGRCPIPEDLPSIVGAPDVATVKPPASIAAAHR
jgi:hypothetical protein